MDCRNNVDGQAETKSLIYFFLKNPLHSLQWGVLSNLPQFVDLLMSTDSRQWAWNTFSNGEAEATNMAELVSRLSFLCQPLMISEDSDSIAIMY